MKSSEMEQRLKECNFRLSKMDKLIQELQEENRALSAKIEQLEGKDHQETPCQNGSDTDIAQLNAVIEDNKSNSDERIQHLSDTLYQFVEEQLRAQAESTQLIINEKKNNSDERIQHLSDTLYQFIEEQLRVQAENIQQTINEKKSNSDERIQRLGDELYNYVNEQIRQVVSHVDSTRESLDNRIQITSDEIYACITRSNNKRDERISALENTVK